MALAQSLLRTLGGAVRADRVARQPGDPGGGLVGFGFVKPSQRVTGEKAGGFDVPVLLGGCLCLCRQSATGPWRLVCGEAAGDGPNRTEASHSRSCVRDCCVRDCCARDLAIGARKHARTSHRARVRLLDTCARFYCKPVRAVLSERQSRARRSLAVHTFKIR